MNTKMNIKMNVKKTTILCLMSCLAVTNLMAQAADHSFNYQGELIDDGTPANGEYDFSVLMIDNQGMDVGTASFHDDIQVNNGLFNLNVKIDGIDYFDGFENYAFEISVRPGDSLGLFTALTPFLNLQAVPLATNLVNGAATTGQVLTFNGFQWAPLTPSGSSSPWVTNGSNINYTTGNVGIGITNPTEDFVVNGTTGGDVVRIRVNGNSKFLVDDNGGVAIGGLTTPPDNGLKVDGETELDDHVLITGNLGINSGSLSNGVLQAAVHIESTSSEGKALFVSSNIGQYGPDITLGGQGSGGTQDEGVISTDQRYPGSDMWLMSNDAVIIRLDQDDNESGNFEIRDGTDGIVFEVSETGVVKQNGSTIHASDKRLKKDIVEIPYGLAEIMVLEPKAYNWKSHDQAYKSFGLIAQDVQKVMKEVVSVGDDKDKTLGLSYTELIPVLIKAMQEQQLVIEEQDRKINQLMMKSENFVK